MIISITSESLSNSRPSSIGYNNIELNYNGSYTFSLEDFTTNTTPAYVDPEGDAMSYIEVLTLPNSGSLKLNSINVSIGDKIYSGSISTGNFTYESDNSLKSEQLVNFKFDVADEGSATVSGLGNGFMHIKVLKEENYPPDSVGNNTINAPHGSTIVFSSEDFTTETTPAYSDPEGDSAYQLKVLSLPVSGTIYLNGTPVTINKIIPFTEISTGYLTYSPDTSITVANSVLFNFSISDEGSKKFTE